MIRPPRIRHTALRVRDLEASIDFYSRVLGMTVTRRRQSNRGNDQRKRESAYVAFGAEADRHALELVEEADQAEELVHGNMFSHINIRVPDLLSLCQTLEQENIEFVRRPTPMQRGDRYHIAIIRDPDGYEIELTDYP